MMRAIFLVHRYLGIGVGALMVVWCLSGVVMMYVPYPRLREAERRGALSPLVWSAGRALERGRASGGALASARVEMLAGRAVLRTPAPVPLARETGEPIEGVSASEAAEVAAGFASPECAPSGTIAPRLLGVVVDDTWTVSGVPPGERPLFRLALDDAAGTEVYVSTTSGRAVQRTTARQRFWSWLGAIPHWIYFVGLRRRAVLWSRVVVYAALAGCFLTVTGIVVGLRQLRRPRGRWSPYQGFALWHHLSGLVFGVFTLTWVASGLFSMNPWGLFESGEADAERARLRGDPPDAARFDAALAALARSPEVAGATAVAAAPLAGHLAFVVERGGGDRARFGEDGRLAPLTARDVAAAARSLAAGGAPASVEMLHDEDAYYLGHTVTPVRLPVIRVVLADADATRYYLDPVSAEILTKVDANGRYYRWLHLGLHRLDLWPGLRARPAWDALMIALLAGALAVCTTGAVLAWRQIVLARR
jgi:PepSY-associated TM region